MLMKPMIFKSLTGHGRIGDPKTRADLTTISQTLDKLHEAKASGDSTAVVGYCRSIASMSEHFVILNNASGNAGVNIAKSGILTLKEQVGRLLSQHLQRAVAAKPPPTSETVTNQTFGSPLEGPLEKLVKKAGVKVVYEYGQLGDVRIRPPQKSEDDWDDLVSGGWCLGMVIEWLGHKDKGDDFWKYIHTEAAEKKFRYLMAAQNLNIESMGGRKSATFIVQSMLKKYKIRRSSRNAQMQPLSGDEVVNAIFGHDTPYSTLVYAGNGMHITGFYKDNRGRPFYMDPNFGEVGFKNKKQIKYFFDKLARALYRDMLIFWVDHYEPA